MENSLKEYLAPDISIYLFETQEIMYTTSTPIVEKDDSGWTKWY